MSACDIFDLIAPAEERTGGSTVVEKSIPASIDLGNLMVVDGCSTEDLPSRNDPDFEKSLKDMTRVNVQQLVNELFSLPRKSDEDGVYVELPLALMKLPRAKPLPSTTNLPKTKWEKFAAQKGIVKKPKRSAFIYDESHKEYLPRHGAKSAKNKPLANWVEELD